MAEVFPIVGGMKIEKFIAKHSQTQDGLTRITTQRALRARAILADHVYAGHSFVEMEDGEVDKYVILNDTRGQAAAMTIEFGRVGGNLDRNGNVVTHMEAVAPLHKAFPEMGGVE